MVNYPNRPPSQGKLTIKRATDQSKSVDFANRGMSFEAAINATNAYYLSRGLAVIHKKPTPVQIVKVDYPQRSRAKIVEAYFRQASTTDYSGVYKGRYIDFEAKETRQKTSFPLKNFHQHQLEHMEQVLRQDGICFVLLHFSNLNQTYLLPAQHLLDFTKGHTGKSIPLTYIKEFGFPLSHQALPQLPYLDIIEKKLIGGDYH